MSFQILFRRSQTAGSVPSTSVLHDGEITLNTNDGILYFMKTTGGVQSVVALSPNAQTATRLSAPVTFTLSGDVSAPPVSFDGSANVTFPLTLAATGVTAGTYNTVIVNAKGLVTSASNVAYGNQSITISGDASGSGTTSIALTLAATGVTAGTYNTVTVNAKGLVTAASTTAYLTANQTITVTGDVTGSGSTALALTLAAVGTAGTYAVVTTDAKGRVVSGRVLASADITTALGYTPVSTALVGAASGLATLDGTGRLTTSQIPAALVGAVVYQGVWNASTNSPALTSGTGTKGYYYKVSVAGSTALDGLTQWNVGDTAIFDGTTWDKIDGIASEVLSVAGRTGVVTLAVADVSGAAPLLSPALTGTPTAPTPATADNSTSLATTAFIKAQGYQTTNSTITVSGDATGSGTTAIALTLAATGVTAGTYGAFAVNSKGLVTAGLNTTYSGDVTGTGSGAATILTLAASGVTAGTYTKVTVSAKGLVTAATLLTAADITTALTYTPVNTTTVGTYVAGYLYGLATLDATNRLPAAQLPTTVVGALVSNGTWNATTNSPSLISATGTKGRYYRVTTASATFALTTTAATSNGTTLTFANTTNVQVGNSVTASVITGTVLVTAVTGTTVTVNTAVTVASGVILTFSTYLDGITNWQIGDTASFNGTNWDKFIGANAIVNTVAGRSGAITLAVADITGAAPLLSPALTGVPTAPTPATNDNSTTLATTAFVKSQTVTLTGDVTGTGSGTIAVALATQAGLTAGTYAGIAVNAKGLVTNATALNSLAAYGITGAANDVIDCGSY